MFYSFLIETVNSEWGFTRLTLIKSLLYVDIQGISEKCGLISLSIYRIHKKFYILIL